MGHTFNRPDEAAMLRILERHPHSPEGAILRLAWLEGLSRSEITELRWDQVDFEGKAIQLPDRAVPLEPSTEACLRERHVRCALRDPHVVISERSKKPMPPESISRLSRLALDSEGQKVNLMDLRHDFVIRQLQTHDWPYVARVSGMAVSTLRDAFSPYLTKPAAPENPLAQRDEAEYLLWRVIQQEGSSPAGLALWMGWKLQMQPGEIASLTWGQVDFDQNLIRLPDGLHGQPPAAAAAGRMGPPQGPRGAAGLYRPHHRAAHGPLPADHRHPHGADPGRLGACEPAEPPHLGPSGGSGPAFDGSGRGAGLADP